MSHEPSIFLHVKRYLERCIDELIYLEENPYADLREEWVFKIVFDSEENKEFCVSFGNAFSSSAPDEGPLGPDDGDLYYPLTDIVHLPAAQLQERPQDLYTTTAEALWQDTRTGHLIILLVHHHRREDVNSTIQFHASRCYSSQDDVLTSLFSIDYAKIKEAKVISVYSFNRYTDDHYVSHCELREVTTKRRSFRGGISYTDVGLDYFDKSRTQLKTDREKWTWIFPRTASLSKWHVDETFGDSPMFRRLFRLLAVINLSEEKQTKYDRFMELLKKISQLELDKGQFFGPKKHFIQAKSKILSAIFRNTFQVA
jgi:hypothetical protein